MGKPSAEFRARVEGRDWDDGWAELEDEKWKPDGLLPGALEPEKKMKTMWYGPGASDFVSVEDRDKDIQDKWLEEYESRSKPDDGFRTAPKDDPTRSWSGKEPWTPPVVEPTISKEKVAKLEKTIETAMASKVVSADPSNPIHVPTHEPVPEPDESFSKVFETQHNYFEQCNPPEFAEMQAFVEAMSFDNAQCAMDGKAPDPNRLVKFMADIQAWVGGKLEQERSEWADLYRDIGELRFSNQDLDAFVKDQRERIVRKSKYYAGAVKSMPSVGKVFDFLNTPIELTGVLSDIQGGIDKGIDYVLDNPINKFLETEINFGDSWKGLKDKVWSRGGTPVAKTPEPLKETKASEYVFGKSSGSAKPSTGTVWDKRKAKLAGQKEAKLRQKELRE